MQLKNNISCNSQYYCPLTSAKMKMESSFSRKCFIKRSTAAMLVLLFCMVAVSLSMSCRKHWMSLFWVCLWKKSMILFPLVWIACPTRSQISIPVRVLKWAQSPLFVKRKGHCSSISFVSMTFYMGIEGFQTVSVVATNFTAKHIAISLVTGNSDAELVYQCINFGL